MQIMWQMFGYMENMSCSPQAAAASIAVLYIAFEHNYKTKTFLKMFGLIAMKKIYKNPDKFIKMSLK